MKNSWRVFVGDLGPTHDEKVRKHTIGCKGIIVHSTLQVQKKSETNSIERSRGVVGRARSAMGVKRRQ